MNKALIMGFFELLAVLLELKMGVFPSNSSLVLGVREPRGLSCGRKVGVFALKRALVAGIAELEVVVVVRRFILVGMMYRGTWFWVWILDAVRGRL